MFRSIWFHRQLNLAIILGVAVAGATLTGALMVGDSVKASLRDLSSARLGSLEYAVVAPHSLTPRLAANLDAKIKGQGYAACSVFLLNGSARTDTRNVSKVQISGVDPNFAQNYPSPTLDQTKLEEILSKREGQIFPSVILSTSLAAELKAAEGDEVVVSFPKPSLIHRDSLYGRTETDAVVEQLRLTVRTILPEQGMGLFSLSPQLGEPFNAFVSMEVLSRSLGQETTGNALLISRSGSQEMTQEQLRASLDSVLELDDLSIKLRETPGYLGLETPGFFFSESMANMVKATAEKQLKTVMVSTYLANKLSKGERYVPYSLISALELEAILPADGAGLEGRLAKQAGEAVINRWTADQLQAGLGDKITLDYFLAKTDHELKTAQATITVVGILPMEGIGADRGLTPIFPGVENADSLSDWDPTFPMDMSLIRPDDESYWDSYHTAPKVFVATDYGKQLWASRFGFYTGFRVLVPEGMNLTEARTKLVEGLLADMDPTSVGLDPVPLRQLGAEASKGATDFTGLFIGLSLFIIVSACLLIGLFFRLLVLGRATEAGILMAVGFSRKAVSRRFLKEGFVLALAGGLLGALGGILYASALLAGMRRFWDLGTTHLYFHFNPISLALGLGLALTAALVSMWFSLRLLKKFSVVALIGKALSMPNKRGSRRNLRVFQASTLVTLLAGAACGLWPQVAAFGFIAGPCLFAAGLAGLAVYLDRDGGNLVTATSWQLALRNLARQSGRSLLNVTLVATAVYTLVAVGLYRNTGQIDPQILSSGAGGYFLEGQTEIPIYVPLEKVGNLDLGLSEAMVEKLKQSEVLSLRKRKGDDASCLNMFAPRQPQVLGVPDASKLNGRFTFQADVAPDGTDPWLLLETPLPDGAIPVIGDLNSVMWILKSGLGKDYVIKDSQGHDRTLRFVGLLKGSLFQSEILVSEKAFQELFPDNSGYGFFLFSSRRDNRADLFNLEKELEMYGFDAVETARKIQAFHAIENTYISIFQLLGALGLLLGTVGLGAVIYRNALERRGEMATLRAFGYRRSRLAYLMVLENAALVVWGIGVGATSAVLTMLPNLLTTSWEGSVLLLLATLLGVFVTSMLASLWAAAKVSRFPLIQDLRAE